MDTFAHIVIPLLVLLALRVDTKKALIMLPLAVVPDIDLFFRMHRMLFHNIFVLVIIPLIIGLYVYKYHRKYFPFAWIGIFYLISHLVLDLSEGIGMLYPLTTDFYSIQASLYFDFWRGIPYPFLDFSAQIIPAEATVAIGERIGAGEAAQQYATVSDVSTGLLLTLSVAALMYFEKGKRFLEIVYELVNEIFSYPYEFIKKIKNKVKEKKGL